MHEQDSSVIFSSTDIKGGVCISYRDANRNFGAIEVFTSYDELNRVLHKVKGQVENNLTSIVYGGVAYRFSPSLRKSRPDLLETIGASFDLRTNILDKLHDILFFDKSSSANDIQILGLFQKKRAYQWVDRKHIVVPDNFEKYKVILPKSNGSGTLGEVLSTPLIGQPLIGHTQTFISIGNFETLAEAENCLKYIKSKFARAMLGILKITQDNPPDKWKYVPLQDFTANSDIDWSQSVSDIDRQLYSKYGLDEKEISFIESHVKEMA